MEKCSGCFCESSRCAGLLAWSKEEAAFWGAPAARGCSLGVRKRLLWGELPLRGAAGYRQEEAASGGAPAARGCSIGEMQRLLLGELPLRGAARLEKCSGCFWGSSRCAGLLDWRNAAAAFGGALAARGCSIGEMQRLLLGELPLRGAAGLQKGGGCFWGSSRCAGLLAWSKEEAAFGGAPAARGCWIGEMQRLLWGELPLRGAAR